MSQLTNIRLIIDGQEVNGFQNLSLVQDIYAIDTITFNFRIESLEDDDSFLVENSKDFIGKNFSLTSEITQYGNTEAEDGFSYQGIITRIDGQRTGSRSSDIITITGNSPDIILKGKPTCRCFHEKTLTDIVNTILQPYPSNILNPNISPQNTNTIPYIVQYMESDYDFLHRLARKFGEWFFYNGQELIFGELPEIDETELILGVDLDAFNFALQTIPPKFVFRNIENTFNDERYRFESGGNNIQQQANTYVQHTYDQSENLFSEQSVNMYNHLNREVSQLQQAMDDTGNLEEISDLTKMSETNGSGSNKQIKIGQTVDVIHPGIEGESEQNFGRYRLTGITHHCDQMLNYQNSFSAMQAGIEVPENTNVNSIVHAKPVRAYVIDNADPENVGRVKVDFAWRSGEEDHTPWLLCASNYTVAEGGNFFVPEIYSEVIVDFIDGDVDHPYVAGSFFSSDVRPFNPHPDWASQPNDIKAIRTRCGNTIEFHDSDGSEKIKIFDKDGNNRITFDSANETLSIHSNSNLNLSADTIKIKAKTFEVEADEKVYIASKKKSELCGDDGLALFASLGNVEMHATQDVKVDGLNVAVSADASLTAKGTANTEVSSSGITVVKGSMVQIN